MIVVRRVGDAIEVDYENGMGQTLAPDSWSKYRKTAITSALRMDGPFLVETAEGPLACKDGYLAVDARGYPYPIAADEFALIYAPVDVGRPYLERVMELGAHPATTSLLRFFAYDHLPAALQDVSAPFGELALKVAQDNYGPEVTVALRKLLEAKDCAVRAAIPA